MAFKYDPISCLGYDDSKVKANDAEGLELVKTVATKNGYGVHVVKGQYGTRVVLTFKGENPTVNPHMWLGEGTQANIDKALKMLEKFAAPSTKDQKTVDDEGKDKANLDKSIRLLNDAMNKMFSVDNDEAQKIAQEIRKIANRAGNLYDDYR